jgi:transposase
MVTMHIDICETKHKNKTYRRVLLRESYYEGGESKKKTIANLSKCTDEEIKAIQFAIEFNRGDIDLETICEELEFEQGQIIGAVYVLNEVAKRLNIPQILGRQRIAKLALWLIFARIIDQGSRLSAVRLAQSHAICDILDLEEFTEDDLYQALDWLADHQQRIEDQLYKAKYPTLRDRPKLYLYDVTSSYVEGEKNELADFGYDRDKKKGKRMIVIGLLGDNEGDPLSVEVFKGNTQDPKTFHSQIRKVVKRFKCTHVTMVGDRGMIKSPQIEDLKDFKLHYITAITKPQIRSMMKKGIIQLSLFDATLCELEEEEEDGIIRYILRRNPVRAEKENATRDSKVTKLREVVQDRNQYLLDHPKAQVVVAERYVTTKITKLKLSSFVEVQSEGHTLTLVIDEEKRCEVEELDGCYVLKTDLTKSDASKETIHDRYKDLKYIEEAFRWIKTVLLEIRPIYVTKEKRTRGHVFEVMLAYKITRVLKESWKDIEMTVGEGINALSSFCSLLVHLRSVTWNRIPTPRKDIIDLLSALNLSLPSVLPHKGVRIQPRKKIKGTRVK